MMPLLRILFTGGWVFSFFAAEGYAHAHPGSSGGTDAVFLGLSIALALPTSMVWTPILADCLFGGMLSELDDISRVERRRQLPQWINWAIVGRHPRWVVFLCLLEGIEHPERHTPFLIGMKYAIPGSFWEKFFAWEVYHSNRAEYVIKAAKILERHGVNLKRTSSPELNLLIFGRDRKRTRPIILASLPQVPEIALLPPKPRADLLKKTAKMAAQLAEAARRTDTQRIEGMA